MAPTGGGGRTVSVPYAVPVDVAFTYLSDPRNRPEWQSSLRAVEMIDEGEPRVGQRWRDLTSARMAPAMVITEMQPDVLWAETGTWHGIEADLTLGFAQREGGCRVDAVFDVRGRGLLRPWAWAATAAGALAVRADLRNAARILARTSS